MMSKLFHKVLDLTDVPLAFIGSMLLLEVKEVLGIIALCLTIGYTLWKWYNELKEKSNLKKKE